MTCISTTITMMMMMTYTSFVTTTPSASFTSKWSKRERRNIADSTIDCGSFLMGHPRPRFHLFSPSILPPRVWGPSTPSMLLSIYNWIVMWKKTKINKKRPGLAYLNQHYIFTTNICEKCPSGIQCWESNPQPSENVCNPRTTRQGLPVREFIMVIVVISSSPVPAKS